MTAAMVIGGASLSGLGLAAYATGGEIGGIVEREAPARTLSANRAAIAPDSYGAPTNGAITISGPYNCEGCGPTLADRKASATAQRYEAALEADEPRFASLAYEAAEVVAPDEAESTEPVRVSYGDGDAYEIASFR